ncbi:GNAT family N-acetyltransferase [Deinococcus hohokamensis]|uniref:GNAT family N-acetyltransferase n=1 Tax=Deinococcus hohokamensis TaxID=309883 RepID=A0ABV9I8N6_9DEIO
MTSPVSVRVRQITSPDDPALAAFGEIQDRSYYDLDSLIPAAAFAHLLASQRGERRNRIMVAEDPNGHVLGGSVYHLLPEAAFSSFVAVAPEARGLGVARALHAARLADVRGAGLAGLFADSVFAGRQTDQARTAEAQVGTDAVSRRRALHALGYRTVDVPYWQPVGGPGGGPLKDLDLLYHPLSAPDTPEQERVPTDLVTATLQSYWAGWLGAERAQREAQALASRAGTDLLALLPATETPAYWRQLG